MMTNLVQIADDLSKAVGALEFGEPVCCVYNPLDYARACHAAYLRRWGTKRPRRAVFVGMNPGPWGMAQTGVPFGEIELARDWIGVCEPVGKPAVEHPRRPIEGFECARSEVSGSRLWGWAKERYGTAERFFEDFFVWNYCPLVFMEESGRNYTPNKLSAEERESLFEPCDEALRRVVAALEPEWVVGVGVFAEERARAALGDTVQIGRILHPSPASPRANRGWAKHAEEELAALGLL